MDTTKNLLLERIKSEKVKEINYSNEKTISYSQYSMYSKCAHAWQLNYLEKLGVFNHTIHTIFGTAVHIALQHYITLYFEHGEETANDLDIMKYFQETFSKTYTDAFTQNKSVHFSSAAEMNEFFEDGLQIIKHFKTNSYKYFTKHDKLVGIEMPLIQPVHPNYPKIYLKGFIDIVIYNTLADEIKIIDIKTSGFGWGKKEKADVTKMQQIIAYKTYFAKQYDIDPEKITIEYLVVKRKLYENLEFPQNRLQVVVPAHGKSKRRKVIEDFQRFIEDCFTPNGEFQVKEYPKTISKESCQYCEFGKNKLCKKDQE